MSDDNNIRVDIVGDASEFASAAQEGVNAQDKLTASATKAQAAWFAQQNTLKGTSDGLQSTSESVQKLLNKYDPLGTKLRSLEADFNALNRAAASGSLGPSQDAAVDKAYKGLNDEIAKTKTLMGNAGVAGYEAFAKIKEGADKGAFATVQAKRELMVLGHEALTGNFSRMPGSFMVLAERMSLTSALFSPMTLAVVTLAAGAGLLFKAFADGHKEQVAMNEALKLTSSYAGVTRGGMRELSETISQTSALTVGAAHTLVTELVSSGRIGGQALASVAALAANFAAATGRDIAKIAPELAKMFSDPIKGAEDLNKQMHFLSTADLDRIEHLQRIGELQQAQLVLSEKLADQLPKHTQNLGLMERAWDAVGKVASTAWDKMKGVGRADTPEDLMSALQKQWLAAVKSGNEKKAQLYQDSMEILQKELGIHQAIAGIKGAVARQNEKEMAAREEVNKSVTHQIALLKDSLELLKNAPDSVDKARRKFEINKQIEDLQRGMGAESYRESIATEEARQKALGELERRAIKDRKRDIEAGLISEAQYAREVSAIRESILDARADSYRKEEKLARDAKIKKDAATYGTEARAAEAARAGLPDLLRTELAAIDEKQRKAAEEVTRALHADYRKTDESRQRAFDLDQMTESNRRLAEALYVVNDRARAAREALDAKFPPKERDATEYVKALAKIDLEQKVNTQSTHEWSARQDELNASWEYGASQAVRKYLDQVGNMAAQSERLMTASLKAGEDAWVSWMTTGKISIRSLFQTLAAESARAYYNKMYAPTIATGMSAATSWLGNFLGLSSGNVGAGQTVANTPSTYAIPIDLSGASMIASYDVGTDYVPRDMVAKVHEGERITPKAFNPAIGNGGGVQVVVYDQRTTPSAAPVGIEQGSGADGMQQIRVFIRDEVKSQFGAGSHDKSMRDNYGLSRVVTRRG